MSIQDAAAGATHGEHVGQRTSYRWYVLGVLTASQTCHFLDRYVVSTIMEPLKREFTLSDSQLGFVAGLAYAIAFAVAAMPIGLLADRVSRRNLLVCILTVWSAMTAVCGTVQSYAMLVTARMGVAAAEAGGTPTSLSLLSDYFGQKERSTAIGIWYMSSAFGAGITYLLGGYIAGAYGWRWAFFVAGMPGILVAVLIFLTVREPKRGSQDKAAKVEKAPKPSQVIAYIRSRFSIFHLMLGMVLSGMTSSASSTWLVSILIREHHLTPAQSGILSAVGIGLFGALGGFLAGIIGDKVSAGKGGTSLTHRLALVCAATAFLAPVAGIGALQSSSTAVALVLLLVFAFFLSAFTGPANGLFVTLLQPRMRGFVISIYQVVANVVGFGLGPLLVGVLSDFIGGENSLGTALTLVLLLNLWSALHFWLASRAARRDLERDAAAA